MDTSKKTGHQDQDSKMPLGKPHDNDKSNSGKDQKSKGQDQKLGSQGNRNDDGKNRNDDSSETEKKIPRMNH
jgi:hypothetical protein